MVWSIRPIRLSVPDDEEEESSDICLPHNKICAFWLEKKIIVVEKTVFGCLKDSSAQTMIWKILAKMLKAKCGTGWIVPRDGENYYSGRPPR
jgi:hypothetical protein